MSAAFTPQRWAFELTHALNAALGPDHFPIDVPRLAMEYSRQRYPDDPVVSVKGDDLPGFDGALFKAPQGRKGWGIIYNDAITSQGRMNFTLAHEFGHYLLHRIAYPQGFRCGQQDVVRWDSEYGQVEYQANVFAANLLMPLDDFRRQIPARDRVDIDMIRGCADRYRVSLIAAVLRWLGYTERRAVLVVSRDGFILWARSSEPALRSGAFFRTSAGPIEIPAAAVPPVGAIERARAAVRGLFPDLGRTDRDPRRRRAAPSRTADGRTRHCRLAHRRTTFRRRSRLTWWCGNSGSVNSPSRSSNS
jgi:hypothetical protein